MNRPGQLAALTTTTALIALGASPGARAEISLPPGFEADIFISGLTEPSDLDIDAEGILYAGSGAGGSGASPVLQIDPQGVVLGSVSVADPDGVAVGPDGTVYIGGGTTIWIPDFVGGTTSVYDQCFSNLDSVGAAADGSIYAGEDDDRLLLSRPGCHGDSLVAVSWPSTGVQAIVVDDATGWIYFGGTATEVLRVRDTEVDTVSTGVGRVNDLAWGPGGAFGAELFVAEGTQLVIRKVDIATGATSTFATFDQADDTPDGLAFADSRTLYIAQPLLGRILRVRDIATGVGDDLPAASWGSVKAGYAH